MLPKEERNYHFIEQTSASQAQAYERALAYLAKNQKDSNEAIKLKEPSTGHIVAQGILPCNVMRQWGDLVDYQLRFTLDIQSKDKKVRVEFTDLEIIHPSGRPVEWDYNQISSKGNLDKSKECTNSFRTSLLKEISGTAAGNW